MLFRSGAAVMWLAALAVAAFNILFGQVIVLNGLAGALIGLVRGAVTGAFLTGVLITTVNSQCERQPVTIASGMRAGVRPFVSLFLVSLILAAPSWIVSQITAVLTVSTINPDPSNIDSLLSGASLLLCCLSPLVLLVSLLLSAIGVGAERGVALEMLGVAAAFRRGWELLRSKLSDILILGLMMLGISLGVLILFGCPAIFFIVIASGATAATTTAPSPDAIYSATAQYSTLFTIFLSVILVPLGIFFSAVWTLAFRRWQGKEDAAFTPMPSFQPPVDLPPIGG
jgi:hypothetical protein